MKTIKRFTVIDSGFDKNNMISSGFLLNRVIPLFSLILLMTSLNATAQMKIYIETDLEGVSGVYKFPDTGKGFTVKYPGL